MNITNSVEEERERQRERRQAKKRKTAPRTVTVCFPLMTAGEYGQKFLRKR